MVQSGRVLHVGSYCNGHFELFWVDMSTMREMTDDERKLANVDSSTVTIAGNEWLRCSAIDNFGGNENAKTRNYIVKIAPRP